MCILFCPFRYMQSLFRKPKECKERHILLMDGTAGDGADSAEDSGTSQPYPATLPGIPKASYLICFYFFIILPLHLKSHWTSLIFSCWQYVLRGIVDCILTASLVGLILYRAVLDNCFNVYRGQWKKI